MTIDPIFHLAESSRWERAQAAGAYTGSTRGLALGDVGFIHCSFRHQVEAAANRFYGDWDGKLLLLQVSPDLVAAEIRVEGVDDDAERFPHIYGPLPTAAVSAVHHLVRGPGGWTLPAELSHPPAG